MSRDRLAALLDPASGLNGIDFVELVEATPPRLIVHFLTSVAVSDPALAATLDGGDRVRSLALAPIVAADWSADADGRPLLTIRPAGEGDFSIYTLTITAPRIDARFATAPVSFKAFCPSPFDCAPLPGECPPDDVAAPAIDYLAKDFASFRRLLLDDAAQRYPGWVERSEADFGMVMVEALSALADEMSYQQDLVAADLAFATAQSRQALVAHARLVDYEPAPARSARAELMLSVTGLAVLAGTRVDGVDGDGIRVAFEVGEGLDGATSYPVDPRWNWPLVPWWWDEEAQCLPRGATEMWVEGDARGFVAGCHLLLQTDLPGESIRQVVTLTDARDDLDPLFPTGTGTRLTRLRWSEADAMTRERDLALTRVGGNLVPATQGIRANARFIVGADAPDAIRAIERAGTNGVVVQRLPLAQGPLAWLPDTTGPELQLRQIAPAPRTWNYTRTLLDADGLDPAYAADHEAWRAVTFGGDGTPIHWEPDGDGGDAGGTTLRFGDGVFGLPPEPGAVFDATWRIGAGLRGNLPADAIAELPEPGLVVAARNPMPAVGGADAEDAERVRRFAPQAFRAHPLRAVRTEDYVATARELAWVQDAGARFRWTGSWHSVFTAVDPKGGFALADAQHLELAQRIDRRRLAGVEAFVPAPRFVSIDLEILICVASAARRDDVERRVLEQLAPSGRDAAARGFFFADRFTFGTPLYRARLEAAVAAVPGVKGVLDIRFRRRAALRDFAPLPTELALGIGEILRIDNDPDWPERGAIAIVTEGGV